MPWSDTDVTKERVKFVLEWERRWKATHGGRVDGAELCRMFGISRPRGYLGISRFRDAGHDVRAMQERSPPATAASSHCAEADVAAQSTRSRSIKICKRSRCADP